MSTFSRPQQAALALLPKFSSLFSLFGSGWILIEVATHQGPKPKRKHPYHRLLAAMSIYDILESLWNFTSTWPIPRGEALWATGTTQTCSAQGYFLTLSVAVPIYNALLAVYYLLVIKYQVREQVLTRRIEPAMHAIAGFWAFFTATYAASTGLINDANLWCWIAPYPSGCKDTLRYGKAEANCERGDNAWVYQWSFYFAPLWLCIIMATVCTLAFYWFVKSLDEKTLKYRRPHRTNPRNKRNRRGRRRGRRTSYNKNNNDDASADFSTTSDWPEDDDDDEDDDDSSSFSIQSVSEAFSSTANSGGGGGSQRHSGKSQVTLEIEADMEEDKFLAGRRDDESLSNPSKSGGGGGGPSARSLLAPAASALQSWQHQRQVFREDYPRTVEVMNQAMWYLGTFYITHVWSTTNRLIQTVNSGSTVFPIILLHSWFDPFQGFLNYFVYQRPRYLFIRKSMPEIGRWRAALRVLRFSFQKQHEAATAAAIGLGGGGRPSPSSGPGLDVMGRRRSSSNMYGFSRRNMPNFSSSFRSSSISNLNSNNSSAYYPSTNSQPPITSIAEEVIEEVDEEGSSEQALSLAFVKEDEPKHEEATAETALPPIREASDRTTTATATTTTTTTTTITDSASDMDDDDDNDDPSSPAIKEPLSSSSLESSPVEALSSSSPQEESLSSNGQVNHFAVGMDGLVRGSQVEELEDEESNEEKPHPDEDQQLRGD